MWSSSDLESIESTEQYTVHILGRVLDQLYEIPMSVEATVGAIGGGEYVQYKETADVTSQLKSSPPQQSTIVTFPKRPTAPHKQVHTQDISARFHRDPSMHDWESVIEFPPAYHN